MEVERREAVGLADWGEEGRRIAVCDCGYLTL